MDTNNLILGNDQGDFVAQMPFAGTRGFFVGAGTTTFRLVCDESTGDVTVFDTQLTAIFVPTLY